MSTRKTKPRREPASPNSTGATVDLGEVIAELRGLMRRAVQQAEERDSFSELVEFMDKYSMASSRLASLLKAQRDLSDEQGLAEAIQMAFAEVLTEMEQERKGASSQNA